MRLKQLIILYLGEYPNQSYIVDLKQIIKSSNIIISKLPNRVAFLLLAVIYFLDIAQKLLYLHVKVLVLYGHAAQNGVFN